jgi:RimJ/RimL family protein N-acetyltransferase
MTTPFLKGERVSLRPILESDLTEECRDWFNDEEACRYNSHHRFPNYDEDMRAYYEETLRSHDHLVLAIVENETDKHIGNVSLQNIDHIARSAEFAIMIGAASARGKGIGKEAMSLIVSHGFKELNLHRIYLGTSDDNVGMQKLALSLGFREEGRLRDHSFKNGKFHDGLCYGLLEGESAL